METGPERSWTTYRYVVPNDRNDKGARNSIGVNLSFTLSCAGWAGKRFAPPMSFASYGFLFAFLPLALGGYWLIARLGPTAAMGWLIVCSVAFYPMAHWPELAASLAANAMLGRWVRVTEGRPAQQWVLAFGIVLNLAGMALGRSLTSAPPGISFIAFTQIGWLLDRRGVAEPLGRPLSYPLLVLFFPHLIAGPILRLRDVEGQFADPATWRVRGDNLMVGGTVLLIGLLKKTLLANPLGAIVTPGFEDPGSLGLLPAWGTALAWSFQLYFDFSGYSDMAVGVASMFGVKLPLNFASPYKAQSIIDYWQRWHMTLTRFLVSAVFNPMAMASMRWRRSKALLLGPLVATMVLAGLWHGATLNYLVFGLLHAAFLAINHIWRALRPGPHGQDRMSVVGRVGLTYLCVLVASVIFRAPTLDVAGTLLSGMVGLHPGGAYTHGALHALWLAGLGGIVWFMPNTQQIVEHGDWRPTRTWAIATGCAATLGILSLGGTHEFVYFQF
jgi:D-alanyl-lipoteichoic acid acyltransferase DltB (MBOAT superfamily)